MAAEHELYKKTTRAESRELQGQVANTDKTIMDMGLRQFLFRWHLQVKVKKMIEAKHDKSEEWLEQALVI